ncbi:MAG: MarR family winged helix-turn-helix transcriptional regulator [Caldimonas sp.]
MQTVVDPFQHPKHGTAPAKPVGCTNFKLRQLTRRVSQHFDRIVSAAGLKTTQYSLLSHIDKLGPIRPGELAKAMSMDASTLTRNLQPLLKEGWAALGPGDNGRSRVVTATPAGRAKRSEAAREWKRAQLDINERFGRARVAQLHGLLEECLALMELPPVETEHA